MNTVPDFISYDWQRETITIFGQEYSKQVFEALPLFKKGEQFEACGNEHGSICLKKLDENPIHRVVGSLNKSYELSPTATYAVLQTPFFCSSQFAEHSDAFCISAEVSPTRICTVTGLGLLNGLLDLIIGDRVATRLDENRRFLGFMAYSETDHE